MTIVAHFRGGPLDGAVRALKGRPESHEVMLPSEGSVLRESDSPVMPEPPRVTYRRGPQITVTDKAAFAQRWPIGDDHFWFVTDTP